MPRLLTALRDWLFSTARGLLRSPEMDEVRALAATNQTSALPRLLWFLYNGMPSVAAEAAHAISRILRSTPSENLPGLEDACRRTWQGRSETLPAIIEKDADILGMFSFHRSGYLREYAVKRLARIHDGSEVRYLLLRLNDWVPQVREAAQSAIEERLRDDQALHFAKHVSLIVRLEGTQRVQRHELLGPVKRLLVMSSGTAALLVALQDGSLRTRRSIVPFLVERSPDVLRSLMASRAMKEDPWIRTFIIPFINKTLPENDAQMALLRLVNDPSPAVRRKSLEALVQRFPEEAAKPLEDALLDPSIRVRDFCRFLLKDKGIDFAARYRGAIHSANAPRDLAAAIAGLGEVGSAADGASVSPHLTHPLPSVRKAVVKSLMRLAPDLFSEQVVSLLQDPSPSVSSVATRALMVHAATLDLPAMTDFIHAGTPRHARLNLVRLFAALSKWPSILRLVDAANSADEEVASEARKLIEAWDQQFNRRQATPSRRQVEELKSSLTAIERSLDPRLLSSIRFTLAAFN